MYQFYDTILYQFYDTIPIQRVTIMRSRLKEERAEKKKDDQDTDSGR